MLSSIQSALKKVKMPATSEGLKVQAMHCIIKHAVTVASTDT